jgi:poly(A) polymerase
VTNLKLPLSFNDGKWLIELVQSAGGEARFVGGCVRDLLLDKIPADIDLATTLTPDKLVSLLNQHQVKTSLTGFDFGTITAIVHSLPYEITTLRKDLACDGRHARVIYSEDWHEDAERRDFTINAMSCTAGGIVYDYFDGLTDLNQQKVRFVGNADQRISEDYLRILRFFRFSAYYANDLDQAGLDASIKYASQIVNLSRERIRQEMLKLFASPGLLPVFRTMHQQGITAVIGLDSQLDFVALENLLKLEQELSLQISPLLRLGVLLHRSPKPDWRLSNHEQHYLSNLYLRENFDETQLKQLIRKYTNQFVTDLVLLHWAYDISSDYTNHLLLAQKFGAPTFPLKGGDLIKLGLTPGSHIGQLLKQAENYWEENDYRPTYDELFEYVRKFLEK